ncbi:hypothetical protein ACLVXC_004710 [Vibrio alginolyticus]|uniref:hypothetical protein n=1 Tax=Vibrio TaxID=662 RepID=UPI001E394663|nr:hypothetical protein [Vibrio sp. MA64]EJL6746706.1 hypothetical protein [Vibrio alginolyticus]MCC9653977.1 hypothetical protein [Vibrio sp. MA64]
METDSCIHEARLNGELVIENKQLNLPILSILEFAKKTFCGLNNHTKETSTHGDKTTTPVKQHEPKLELRWQWVQHV